MYYAPLRALQIYMVPHSTPATSRRVFVQVFSIRLLCLFGLVLAALGAVHGSSLAADAPEALHPEMAQPADQESSPLRLVQLRGEEFSIVTQPQRVGAFLLCGFFCTPSDEQEKEMARQLQDENRLRDPVVLIIEAIAKRLERESPVVTPVLHQGVEADESSDRYRVLFGSGAICDLKTQLWQLRREGLASPGYKTMYAARARLFDVSRGTLVWETTCEYASPDARTLDDLRNFGGAPMRRRFAAAATACADKFLGALQKYTREHQLR